MTAQDFSIAFKQKMTKSQFESTLASKVGAEGLAQAKHSEDGKVLTLYYKDDYHCATWISGEGWIFKWALTKE
jgi:hypothetical protein